MFPWIVLSIRAADASSLVFEGVVSGPRRCEDRYGDALIFRA
jgi:hypothetical protein